MKLQSVKTVFTGFLLLIIIITTIIVVSIKQTQYVKQLSIDIDEASQVINRTEYLLTLSLDNETGARGFMITGDTLFLAPFEQAKIRIYPAMDSLRKVNHAGIRASVDSLCHYTIQRLAFSIRIIQLRKIFSFTEAIRRYNAYEGKRYTDQIRFFAADIQKKQSKYISQLRSNSVNSFNMLNIIQYCIVGSTIILLILFTNRFRNELKQIKTDSGNFESIIDASPDANIIVNDNGKIIMLNKQAEKLFGYNKTELLNQPVEILLPEINRHQHKQHRVNYTKQPHTRMMGEGLELFALNSSKEVIPVEISLAPIKTSMGTVISASIRDITERKEINLKLQHLNKQLSQKVDIQTAHIEDILESVSDAFIALDRNFRFIYINQSAANKYAQKASDLLGKVIWEALPGLKSEVFFSELNNCMSRQLQKSFEEFDAVNNRWLFHAVYPSSEGITIYTKDITTRKLQEEEMRKANDELRRLSGYLQQVREEERKSIARDIHDDLGQQLTGLQMDAHWLKRKMSGSDEILIEKIQEISQSIDMAIISVRKILSDLRPNILDDLGMIAAMEWLNLETMKRYPAIQLQLITSSTTVNINPETATSLFRIYQEAVNNAIKHANAGKITGTLSSDAFLIKLIIEDDGKGIEDQDVKSGGYGLLGIRERTYILGGTFSIQSESGKGTRLTIIIPVT